MDAETARRKLPGALMKPAAYPHDCRDVRLIETHMSWLFLTGEFAYKVKKPIHFDFVNFSTVELRRHFCEEELRLNRRFAPDLYLSVVTIVAADDNLLIAEDPDHPGAVEWAVRMRQFDPAAQADKLLDDNRLTTDELHRFGSIIASQHRNIAPHMGAYDAAGPMRDNFTTLCALPCSRPYQDTLNALSEHLEREIARLGPELESRQRDHQVKECHGDLHLSNMVRLQDGLCAFDCLEFDAELRNIDVMCDAGFLLMDCLVRGRRDLGYAFIDGYLNVSGDYAGAALLPIFADYRSMVRAKVAGLRLDQEPQDNEAAAKLERHLEWNAGRMARPPGRLLIMCGVSGTGKSYWAEQLVRELGAIRIRSDVLRKVQAGMQAEETSGAAIGEGIYNIDTSSDLYEAMAVQAQALLACGENVIIDAACLHAAKRRLLYEAARAADADSTLLHLTGAPELLHERIARRNATGDDPSEADEKVLDWQLEWAEPPGDDEPSVSVDTSNLTLAELLALLSA